METIVFDNFKSETPEWTESDGKNNLHAIIDSPTPLTPNFYKETPITNYSTWISPYSLCSWGEMRIIDLTTLIPSISWGQIIDGVNNVINNIVPLHTICVVDNKGNVALVYPTNYISYKTAPQTINSNQTSINLFGNKIVLTSDSIVDGFYYINNDLSGNWTKVTLPSGSYANLSLTFNNNLFVSAVEPAGGYKIHRYNQSFSLIGSLFIPSSNQSQTVHTRKLFNINNQYIGIIFRDTNVDYLMLWDGDVFSNVNQKILIPGRTIDAFNYLGGVYIVVEKKNGFEILALNGNSWKSVFYYKKGIMSEYQKYVCYKRVSVFDSYLVTLIDERMLFINLLNGESFGYAYNNSQVFPQSNYTFVAAYRSGTISAQENNYIIYYPASMNGLLNYFWFDTSGLGNNRNYYYRSNWIVAGKRVKLNNFKLYYENPTSPDGYVNIRFVYIDEKRGGTIQEKSYYLLSSDLPNSYKEFTIGIECTKFYVKIWNSNNTTSPRIIKRAILEYERIE
jgi:hypothetical protein